mgnify:CR=1 FL=1
MAGRSVAALPTQAARAAPTSADVLVDGSATPWCGMLCGRVEPARCRVAVVAGAAADDHDTLQLTLVKAERRLWRAPWRELIADVDAREVARRLPRREAIMCGEWSHSQSATATRMSSTATREVLIGTTTVHAGRMPICSACFESRPSMSPSAIVVWLIVMAAQ